MGFAASQARLIVLTQRKSDLELRMQQISNAEMMLAMQSEEVANEYTRKLSNQTMKVNQGDGTMVALTAESLASKGLRVVDQGGNVVFGQGADNSPVDELGGRSTATYSMDYGKLRAALQEDPRFQTSKEVTKPLAGHNTGTDEELEYEASFEGNGVTYYLNEEGTGYSGTEYGVNQEAIEFVIQSFQALGSSISEASFINTQVTPQGFDAPISLAEFYTEDDESSPLSRTMSQSASGTGYDRGAEILEGIKSGKYTLQKYDSDKGDWVTAAPDSNIGVSVGYDTSDDAAAEAEYNAKTAAIQAKEKRLQTEMVQVQSQQKACETEMESVKKLIEKNTEQIFKYYN